MHRQSPCITFKCTVWFRSKGLTLESCLMCAPLWEKLVRSPPKHWGLQQTQKFRSSRCTCDGGAHSILYWRLQQSCTETHTPPTPSLVPRLSSSSACGKKEPGNIGGFKPLTSGSLASVPPIRLQNEITWKCDLKFNIALSINTHVEQTTWILWRPPRSSKALAGCAVEPLNTRTGKPCFRLLAGGMLRRNSWRRSCFKSCASSPKPTFQNPLLGKCHCCHWYTWRPRRWWWQWGQNRRATVGNIGAYDRARWPIWFRLQEMHSSFRQVHSHTDCSVENEDRVG